MVTVAVGCDHRGYELAQHLLTLSDCGGQPVRWVFVGCKNRVACDYPHYAQRVVRLVLSHEADVGVLACGTGVGMAIAANRYAGVFAGVAWNATVAQRAREEDNCNILVIPADYVAVSAVGDIVAHWLTASFMKGKYQRRIELIDQPEPRNAHD